LFEINIDNIFNVRHIYLDSVDEGRGSRRIQSRRKDKGLNPTVLLNKATTKAGEQSKFVWLGTRLRSAAAARVMAYGLGYT